MSPLAAPPPPAQAASKHPVATAIIHEMHVRIDGSCRDRYPGTIPNFRFGYLDDDAKETLRKTNLSKPFALEATEDDDRFHISFPRGAFGWYDVEFNLKATEVEVITISGGIS